MRPLVKRNVKYNFDPLVTQKGGNVVVDVGVDVDVDGVQRWSMQGGDPVLTQQDGSPGSFGASGTQPNLSVWRSQEVGTTLFNTPTNPAPQALAPLPPTYIIHLHRCQNFLDQCL